MELKLKIKYEEQLKNDPLAKVGYTVNKKRRFKSLLWVSKNPIQAICDLKLEHMFEGTPETFQKIINTVAQRQGIDKPRKVRLPKEDMYSAMSLDDIFKGENNSLAEEETTLDLEDEGSSNSSGKSKAKSKSKAAKAAEETGND